MRRINSITAVLAVAATLLTGSVFAAEKAMTSDQIYQSIMNRIDSIEQSSPKAQAEAFKLREDVEKLYDRLLVGDREATRQMSQNIDRENSSDIFACCKGLKGDELRKKLLSLIKNHYCIGYQGAQDAVFEDVDNRDGWVECVYTGRKLKTDKEPPATNMNIEHSWPQSKGAEGTAKADLHHLFPADAKANGRRGNFPFGMVSDANAKWAEGGSKLGNGIFEVRKEQRGNTARGMFYFAVRYDMQIDGKQEKVLRQWHKEDPVDELERKRNDRIENYQHNRNPFVDHPEFVDMIEDF